MFDFQKFNPLSYHFLFLSHLFPWYNLIFINYILIKFVPIPQRLDFSDSNHFKFIELKFFSYHFPLFVNLTQLFIILWFPFIIYYFFINFPWNFLTLDSTSSFKFNILYTRIPNFDSFILMFDSLNGILKDQYL